MVRAYNTKQRETILSVIKKQTKDFSIKELHEKLGGEIGLTTVYRMVDQLASEGVLVKTMSESGVLYQYVEPCEKKDHFYLKCDKCGTMSHVDCEQVEGLSKHIFEEHGFKPIDSHVVINGVCKKCIKGGE